MRHTSSTDRAPSRLPLLALTLGHCCADACSGALIALPVFLVGQRHYSYAAVGIFALAASVASALLQPLLGAHGDRGRGFWLMPLGLVFAGIGVGAVGVASSYPLTLMAVVVCSAGVAAYHPEGARWARLVSGGRVTIDMGVFSMGGSVGYAFGPLLVAAALRPLGLSGTLAISVVPLTAAVIVLAALRRSRPRLPVHIARRAALVSLRSEWGPFARLLLLGCASSGLTTGVLIFMPQFLMHERAASPGASTLMLDILLAAAVVGTLVGGMAAQRFGRRVVLVAPQLALAPAVLLLHSLSFAGMLPVIVVIGIAMNSSMSVSLVLAQEYMPTHMGFATGVTVGVCGGVGGLIVAALGVLADRTSPGTALLAIAGLPLLVAALGASLPRPLAASDAAGGGLQIEA